MRSSGIPGFVRVSDKTGSLPEESKRNSNVVFGHQLLSLPLHRKIRKPRRSRDYKMREKWRALQKRQTEKSVMPSHTWSHKAFPDAEPKGIGKWWHSKPAMPTLPTYQFRLPAKASREWMQRMNGAAVHRCRWQTLSCRAFRYIRLANIPNSESRIWSEQQGEYLSEVCVSEQDTRTLDVYDQIQTSCIRPMWRLSASGTVRHSDSRALRWQKGNHKAFYLANCHIKSRPTVTSKVCQITKRKLTK